MARKATEKLMALLLKERSMLKEGALDCLADIRASKEAAMQALERTQPRPGELDEILTLARRNAVMLDAVIAGVENARHRIQAAARARKSLNSYAADGRARHYSESRPDLEHKA